MKNLKRPKTILPLIILFSWFLLKDIEILTRHSTVLDFAIFQHIDMTYIFLCHLGISFVFNAATIWFLIKPRIIGLWIAISGLALSALYNVIAMFVVVGNLEVAKNAYKASREFRGMSINEDFLEFVFKPSPQYAMLAISILFFLLIGWLLYREKKYFEKQ